MPKVIRLKSDPIYLRTWGALVAMNFRKSAGSGEVSMSFPEVCRFLDALVEYESTKPEPNPQVIDACEVLRSSFFLSDIQIRADVPITQERVRLVPDPGAPDMFAIDPAQPEGNDDESAVAPPPNCKDAL